jgi:hypothetical protein
VQFGDRNYGDKDIGYAEHAPRSFSSGIPLRNQIVKAQFCLRILSYPQDTYERDKKGRKRPLGQRKRYSYISTTEKVMKHDLEKLKSWLEACSNYIL